MAVLFGMGLGLVYGGLFAVMVGTLVPLMAQARPEFLARVTSGPRFALLATALLYVGILYWGLVGAAFGALFLLAEAVAPAGSWGVPNLAYTLGVSGLAVVVAGPGLILFRSGRLQVAVLAVSFVVAFGWLVPLLGA
ncbi:MAG: hypothetical protein HY688_01135 [Chloroflexi bacterium]|nr:hypothetical protein [Chloroflexota bacterium]